MVSLRCVYALQFRVSLAKAPPQIPFTNAPPLYYQLTHPRVIYVLGFLVSSLAKRDLMGRKPKKKVFASEGIIAIDKELRKEIAGAFPAFCTIVCAHSPQSLAGLLFPMSGELMFVSRS